MNSPVNARMCVGKSAAAAAVLCAVLLVLPRAGAMENEKTVGATVTGSGEQYKTTVERQTKGTLSSEDLRQASLLSAEVLMHVNKSAPLFSDEKADAARAELEKAKSLIDIVHSLLPVRTTTTTVKDAKGKEVYSNTEDTQYDIIRLFGGIANVEVIKDVLDAKKVEFKGGDYEGTVSLQTTVFADLGYISRKVERALKLVDKPAEALREVALAQAYGVDVRVAVEEAPLSEAQEALVWAEKMVNAKRFDAAKDNLRESKLFLEEFAENASEADANKAGKMCRDIEEATARIEKKGAAGKIRECWSAMTALSRGPKVNAPQK